MSVLSLRLFELVEDNSIRAYGYDINDFCMAFADYEAIVYLSINIEMRYVEFEINSQKFKITEQDNSEIQILFSSTQDFPSVEGTIAEYMPLFTNLKRFKCTGGRAEYNYDYGCYKIPPPNLKVIEIEGWSKDYHVNSSFLTTIEELIVGSVDLTHEIEINDELHFKKLIVKNGFYYTFENLVKFFENISSDKLDLHVEVYLYKINPVKGTKYFPVDEMIRMDEPEIEKVIKENFSIEEIKEIYKLNLVKEDIQVENMYDEYNDYYLQTEIVLFLSKNHYKHLPKFAGKLY